MYLYYFLEVWGTVVGVIIGISVLFLTLRVGVCGMDAINYNLTKKFDKSNVCVFIDNKNVFCGAGYKVKKNTITDNLQAPYFEVIIRGKNHWDIQNRYIGKDIKVINAGKD